jgi:hypothetical protein
VENLDTGQIECVCPGVIAAGPDETADPPKAAIRQMREQPRADEAGRSRDEDYIVDLSNEGSGSHGARRSAHSA